MASVLAFSSSLLFAEEATDSQQVLPEPKPDQALVYVIQSVRTGMMVSTISSDQGILARLKGKTYTFAYMSPGWHLIWSGNWKQGLREIELLPGTVYYLWHIYPAGDLAFLDEEEGKEFLQELKLRELTRAEKAEGDRKAAEQEPKVRGALVSDPRRAVVEKVPMPAARPNNDGLLRVPAYTRVKLELMQTVSSGFNKPADAVWFRVAEDAAVDGTVWLRAGSPVKSTIVWLDPAGSHGRSGSLQIQIPAVRAADAVLVPVAGEILTGWKSRTTDAGAVAAAVVAGPILGGLLVKGRESHHIAGSQFTVATRAECWVAPAGESPAVSADPAAPITIRPLGKPQLALSSRNTPEPVEFVVETAEAIHGLELVAVRDWTLPEAVKATLRRTKADASSKENTLVASFDGWNFLRNVPPSSTPVSVRFRATRPQGEAFAASAEVALQSKN